MSDPSLNPDPSISLSYPQSLPGVNPAFNPTLTWLNNAIDEADAFLRSQPGFDKISTTIDTIMSEDEKSAPINPTLSNAGVRSLTRTNRIAKISEDLAAMMTDTKPFWEYTVANRRFEQHAQIFGKLATFWYAQRSIDLRMGDCIKYHNAAGTGYFHMYFDPEIGDINAHALDPRNVLPISPKDYDSLESCRGVATREKVPVSYIKDRYGFTVAPDSDAASSSWLNKTLSTAGDIVSPIFKWQQQNEKTKELPKIPAVWLYTCYIKDPRLNESSDDMHMGKFNTDPVSGEKKPANNWSYVVKPGEQLYPQRRLIVWVADRLIYDGPSMYWHGRFPIIKLTLNPQPWSFLGKAPLHDLLPLQRSLNRNLRIVDDHNEQVANPGSIHDKNNVSRNSFEKFDTRVPGYKIWQNPINGKGIQIVPPPPLDASIFEHIKWIQEEMKELSGVTDVSSLTSLKQLPSTSTVESILNAMTPAIRARSRVLEAFVREVAMQFAYNVTQFYTIPMRVAILGPGGITQDDFDFDPGSLIPDFIHDKHFNSDGSLTAQATIEGPMPKFDRAKEFLRRFIFKIAPGSLLNAAQVEQKLIYLQLARAGWMDIFTLWESLGIPNIGVLPDNVRTIPERIAYQQEIGLSGDVNPAGRKASGQQGPRIVNKES